MILLHGTGTHNKGAELMAVAVLEHFRARRDAPEFAVPAQFGSYCDRARYGLWTLVDERRLGRSKLASWLMHRCFRHKYGLAREEDCEVVIDASGFAFGDQHGPKPTRQMAKNCRRWKRQGKRIVLLPQAFGPFTSPEIRAGCRELVDQCDLVFAREERSHQHLAEAAGPRDTIRMAPDFTIALQGKMPCDFVPSDKTAFVVPNSRMLDKTDQRTQTGYLPFLAEACQHLRQLGLRPSVLLHAPEDAALARRLAEQTPHAFDVLEARCPLQLKGILGTGRLVIGSRFHALVSALSQGVPVLAVGWSHKYDELLRDFDCSECLVSIGDGGDLKQRLATLADSPQRDQLVARIRAAGQRLQKEIAAMWAEVDRVLGIPASR
jgi:polysaccharide pyruvyl transferase WcaK-like protein